LSTPANAGNGTPKPINNTMKSSNNSLFFIDE
jgi:hypothetical protein